MAFSRVKRILLESAVGKPICLSLNEFLVVRPIVPRNMANAEQLSPGTSATRNEDRVVSMATDMSLSLLSTVAKMPALNGSHQLYYEDLSQFAIQITIIDLQTELYPNRTYLWLSGAFGENRAFLILRRENPEEQRDGEAGRCETIPARTMDEPRNELISCLEPASSMPGSCFGWKATASDKRDFSWSCSIRLVSKTTAMTMNAARPRPFLRITNSYCNASIFSMVKR
ncbi:hypothetical protein HUJ05_006246 [Dendroctonus ponderosae]|nr:hypothetical protein HUJ05_006246 [Dendroctonus ponderosae]